MGSGKTSKGKILARQLAYSFADMDAIIEKNEGMTVKDIFSLKGEEWFRIKEREVLLKLGNQEEDLVVSTGGGAPCFFDNMDFINKTGISVYLKMSPLALFKRLKGKENRSRPLLRNMKEEELLNYIKQSLTKREPFYLRSKIILNANGLRIKNLVESLSSI